jgi:DNA-binding CsgD family transcriptional regulator
VRLTRHIWCSVDLLLDWLRVCSDILRTFVETEGRKVLQGPAISGDVGRDVFSAQQRLRAALLDRPGVRYKPARDLAAHMLLHIDDLTGCWSIAANWLQAELGCHRVDTGFGEQGAVEYHPGFAEARSQDYDVPSFAGAAVDNRDAMMQAMWREDRPLVYGDIKHDARVSARMRQRMSGARTRSKIAWALRTPQGGYGLICADWTEHLAPVQSGLYDCFEQTVADVLSPVIYVAKALSGAVPPGSGADTPQDENLALLTPSETEVARLVAKGLSYKEIARMRGRSFSTIDHQLRSIRDKTGTTSTAALIHLLSRSNLI